jgi:Prokaryotic homologs of the JAB domain
MLFRSAARDVGLELKPTQLSTLRKRCAASWPKETGGVLVGRYNRSLDIARVTRLPLAPPDSTASIVSFVRGVHGLTELFEHLWQRDSDLREYYLGEWHYHPGQVPVPSSWDDEQMRAIARDGRYQCPEPVLLIVGGGKGVGWSFGAQVYFRGGGRKPLQAD